MLHGEPLFCPSHRCSQASECPAPSPQCSRPPSHPLKLYRRTSLSQVGSTLTEPVGAADSSSSTISFIYFMLIDRRLDIDAADLPPLPVIQSEELRRRVFTHRSYFARPTHVFEDSPHDPSPDNEMSVRCVPSQGLFSSC
jgi:hypothetical protein